jgi:cyclin-dependent kinase 7
MIAIKKIKMGQFKDGLDLTAIREVKYLQELRHPNIIEVRCSEVNKRSTQLFHSF